MWLYHTPLQTMYTLSPSPHSSLENFSVNSSVDPKMTCKIPAMCCVVLHNKLCTVAPVPTMCCVSISYSTANYECVVLISSFFSPNPLSIYSSDEPTECCLVVFHCTICIRCSSVPALRSSGTISTICCEVILHCKQLVATSFNVSTRYCFSK